MPLASYAKEIATSLGIVHVGDGELRGVTIKDVAELAGVSKATVSYVLNGDTSHVSVETAERVFAAMRRLNYRPNAVARSLVRRRTQVIGVVVASIERPPYPEAVRGISDTMHQHGYKVLLLSSEGNSERELDALNLLHERLADAMIIVSASGQGGSPHLSQMARSGTPVAVINRYDDNLEKVHVIRIDNTSGTYAATRHLIRLGHHALAFIHAPIEGPRANRASIERVEGFQRAMKKAGLQVNPNWLRVGASAAYTTAERTTRAVLDLLASTPRPSAILCANDYTAMAVLRATKDLGLRVPGDLAVVGHDNIPAGAFCTPSLTSVKQPMYDAGVAAARAILGALDGATRPIHTTLPCELVVRESCGAGVAQ